MTHDQTVETFLIQGRATVDEVERLLNGDALKYEISAASLATMAEVFWPPNHRQDEGSQEAFTELGQTRGSAATGQARPDRVLPHTNRLRRGILPLSG